MSDDSNAIRWKGTVSEPLYLRAVRLHSRQSLSTRLFLTIVVVLMLAGAVAGFATGRTSLFDSSWPLLVIVAWLLLVRFAPILGVKRAYKTHVSLRSELNGTATDSGVEVSSESGVSKLPWNQYHRALVADDLVLLYQSAQLFQMVSRSWFVNENDWRSFTDLVRSRAPRPPRSLLARAWDVFQWIALAFVLLFLLWAMLD